MKRLSKFMLIGLVATAIDFLFFNLLAQSGWNLTRAHVFSVIASTIFAFFGNLIFTFLDVQVGNKTRAFSFFLLLGMSTGFVHILVVEILQVIITDATQFEVNLAKVLTLGGLTILRYLISKRFIFV